MKRLVELHFERCLIALATMKDYLLRDIDKIVNDNRMIEHHSSLFPFHPHFFHRKTHSRNSNQVETIN
jgi:hypothetical protein